MGVLIALKIHILQT